MKHKKPSPISHGHTIPAQVPDAQGFVSGSGDKDGAALTRCKAQVPHDIQVPREVEQQTPYKQQDAGLSPVEQKRQGVWGSKVRELGWERGAESLQKRLETFL